MGPGHQGSRDAKGKVTSAGKDRANDFTGNNDQRAGGTLVGTRGRDGALQPANLANGDPVFAVIAYNINTVQTQIGISQITQGLAGAHVDEFNRPIEWVSRYKALGQRVRPVSLFIHESEENREFSRIGARNSNYNAAHEYAMRREDAIRQALNITGGFAGGVVQTRVPK